MAGEPHIVILGCGFTGKRVAARLLTRGCVVTAVTRTSSNLSAVAAAGGQVVEASLPDHWERLLQTVPPGAVILHSLPSIEGGWDREILKLIGRTAARVVYLSTTGVYGPAAEVDENTPVLPRTPRAIARVETEAAVRNGPWRALILRPAAIYGPGRGAHVSLRRGTFHSGSAGENFISRIHVDDLAAHVEAALFSPLTGSFPVADAHPCPSGEIAAFCAESMGLKLPEACGDSSIPETRRSNRKVDGSAIRRLLGVSLRYPSYREGIPACLEEEAREAGLRQ